MTLPLPEESRLSNSRTVRLATGMFFISLPLAIWGETYVPSKIVVSQNPAATAENLLANEFIFRTSILSHFTGTVIFVLMIFMFYKVFRPVDKQLSRLMLASVLAQLPIVLIVELFRFTALMLLKNDAPSALDSAQQQEAAYTLFRMHAYGIRFGKLFFGLSFIPLGMVILKSRFTPRIIGILMIVGGVGYVLNSITYILLQRPTYLAADVYLRFVYTAWIWPLLWFLIKGVKEPGGSRVAT